MRVLVVKNPFQGVGPGDRISDPAKVEEILAGESAHHVVVSDHHDAHVAEDAPLRVFGAAPANPASKAASE